MGWITSMILQQRGRKLQTTMITGLLVCWYFPLLFLSPWKVMIHIYLTISDIWEPGPCAANKMTYCLGGAALTSSGPWNISVSQLVAEWDDLFRRWSLLVIAVVQGGLVFCDDFPALEDKREGLSGYNNKALWVTQINDANNKLQVKMTSGDSRVVFSSGSEICLRAINACATSILLFCLLSASKSLSLFRWDTRTISVGAHKQSLIGFLGRW